MNKLKNVLFSFFRNNSHFKKLLAILIVSISLYAALFQLEILTDYLYVLEFLIVRLIIVFLLLTILQILLDLPFTKSFQEELEVFNISPKDQPFVVLLRKHHFQLFLVSYVSYTLGTTYFVENFMISYVLGMISFICVALYLVQFVVYTRNYIKLQRQNSIYKNRRYILTSMIPNSQTIKKVGVLCFECLKTGVQLGVGGEVVWKLTHGGMNDMSPWRQSAMNKMFPDDRTKVWSEVKAGMAIHNRAMGRPHDDIYKTGDIADSIKESISKDPKSEK